MSHARVQDELKALLPVGALHSEPGYKFQLYEISMPSLKF